MKIEHEEGNRKGTFYITEDGERVAELAYLQSGPDRINLYHTEVDERLRGKGVGNDLVKAAVDHARANHLKIIPTCPFAKKVMETSAYRDVLSAE
jgi:predicted GNAT family acetyltransferase